MEEHVRKKRVASDDTGRLATVHGMDGSGVFDGVELALRLDCVLHAVVFFHWNGFDPGHEEEDHRVKNAIEAQRKLYPIEYATPVHPVNSGETSGIVASHSLLPDVLFHPFDTFRALMSPDLPLKRQHHEIIATMGSVVNR